MSYILLIECISIVLLLLLGSAIKMGIFSYDLVDFVSIFVLGLTLFIVILFAILAGFIAGGITGILQLIKRKHMNSAEFMLLVMAASIINALGCDLVLAGLQRYMTYTLGMTWIGLFLLVRPLWERKKGNI